MHLDFGDFGLMVSFKIIFSCIMLKELKDI